MPTTATSPSITIATGAIPFSPANYQSSIGTGGYAFAYADSQGSISCLASSAFCVAGSTVAKTATNSATAYGGGVGVNLNQMMGAMGAAPTYMIPAGKLGIAYALSTFPTGTTMIVDNSGVDYSAALAGLSGMVPWASFTAQSGDAGGKLSGPPLATHINFQVSPGAVAGPFNFCVTSLGFY